MSAAHRCSTVLLSAMLVCLLGTAASEASPPAAYGRLPLSFEANQGQTHPSVEFVARSTGYQLFLRPADAMLVLRRPGGTAADVLRMTLLGASPERMAGVDQLSGTANYLIGNDPAKWRTSIPTYAKVLTRGVYPGVDLVYYGNQRQLEYDFIIAPGADPASIRMAFQGLTTAGDQPALDLDGSGDLTLRVPGGDVRLKQPVAYQQDANGERRAVKVAFVIVAASDATDSSHVAFQVGAYDRSRPLVIDPVLSYSTYLGGAAGDAGMAIAVRNGEAYVTGYTDSLNFPPAGGDRPGQDAFVAKLNATGSLAYATYLGGDGEDAGMGIAVDSAGQAYVTGFTNSTDFPTAPVGSPLYGPQGLRDAFVTKVNATGTGFVYSTYLGGDADDIGLGIAVDSTGNAYVTGWTESGDFPVTSSNYQGAQGGRDAFVTKLSGAGSALAYSTYLGGSGSDEGWAIAVDTAGNAYVTGLTMSTAFPTAGTALQTTLKGTQDAFIAKLDPAGSLPYATYFGGDAVDAGMGIAVDATNLIYVTGSTTSADLRTKFAYQTIKGAGQDAFVAKFNPAGSGPLATLLYSTFLGGAGDEAGQGIAVDEEGQAYITGFTTSTDFPTFRAAYPSLNGPKDAFVAKFDPAEPNAPSLRYSTFLGGGDEDDGYGVALDAAGSAYVAGLTRSANFPIVGSGTTFGGVEDAFVAKLSEPDLIVSAFIVPATAGEGAVITVTDTIKNTGIAPAAASTTKFYLSTDTKLDITQDTFLGSRAVPALAPTEEDAAPTQLTLPAGLPPATYSLFAKADADDAVGESFESNNRIRKTIVVGSDLTVSALSVTGSGLTITVTDTTKNLGGAPAAASSTEFFFSSGSGEVSLGSRPVASLAAGAESVASTDLTIPGGTAAGSYTIIARSDAAGVLTETNETNNSKSTPFAVGVDLVVTALSVPSTTGAGASISVTATFANQGAIAAAATTAEFFLSPTNSTNPIDPSAVSIGTQPVPVLAPGATSAVPTSLTIPPSTAAGSFFVIANANAGASPIAETSTTNNMRTKSSVVGPDLTISFLFPASASAGPGGTVTFKDTTRNLGGGNAAASVTKLYLSTDATYDPADVEVGTRPVPALTPGAQDFNSAGLVLTIPANTAAGSYFIVARANAGTTPIGETNATNNTSSAPLAVGGADLVVSALTVSLSGGSTLSITDTTKNQGTGPAGASTTRFWFSVDGTLDEATDTLLGTRDVGTLAAGASSDATTTFPLPAGTAPGLYTIFAKADATGAVTESDETNNRRSGTIDTRGADLVISNLLFSWGTGATLNVTDTTRNEGAGTAAASTTRLYLSTDATFDASDVALGSRSVVNLAAGNQSTSATALTIPAVTAPGDYVLIARADDASAVGEVNEGNNTTSIPIAIRPDLTVDTLTVPATGSAGASISVSVTVKNSGPIPAGASTLKLFLSSDTTLDGTDTLLATRAIPALGVGKTNSASIDVTLPAGIAGSFSVIAQADADNEAAESNEGNNTKAKAISIGPDLIVSAFSAPTAANGGSTITVSDTTKNQASAPAPASVTRFYLSTDTTFDPGDVLLGSRPVPALGARKTNAANTTLTIPAATTGGNYFVLFVADGEQVIPESIETNNTASAPIVIGSDLVVSALTVPASAGGSAPITVTDTTTNQGGGQVGASTTKFYLSTNTTFEATDTLLGSRAIGTLAAGAASTGSVSVTIPPGTANGTYYIIARADADGVVSEVSESNNTRTSGAVVIGPDLVVSAISVPLTSGAGATINVSTTVANVGGAEAAGSTLKLYLSSDAALDAGDTFLGSRIVPLLGPGATSEASTAVTIPVDASAGVFFVIAQADANNQVAEVNEANNTAAGSLKTGGDLLVSSLSVPAEAGAGLVITLTDTTQNQGAAAAASVTRFYFSTDTVLDASDTVLGSRNVPALAKGASSRVNTNVTLPAGIAGSFYIIAQADATGVIPEAIETNNLRSELIKIGPDLVIGSLSAPNESGAGLSISVVVKTKNEAAAGGASITRIYLSTNNTLDGNDTLLGSRNVPALVAGAVDQATLALTLPSVIPAGEYFIIAKANADGALAELDPTNNTKARSIILGPDLSVSSLNVPSTGGAGLPITITDTTRNTGAGSAAASSTSYYLSADTVLDATDVLIGSRPVPLLAPGASNSGSVTVTVPPGMLAGTYNLIAQADGPNGVSEINEGNNTTRVAIKIGPDLAVSAVTAASSVTAGATVTVTHTTTNSGAGAAGAFTVRVYLSSDTLLGPGDVEVGSAVVDGLAPGTAATGPISVTIPPGTSGSLVYLVVADADNVVSELNDGNNMRTKSVTITP